MTQPPPKMPPDPMLPQPPPPAATSRAKLGGAKSRVAWIAVVPLLGIAIARIVVVSRDDTDTGVSTPVMVLIVLAVLAVIVVPIVWLALRGAKRAKATLAAAGFPWTASATVPRIDLVAVGGWRGKPRNRGAAVAGYLGTDGTLLQWVPQRMTRKERGAVPFAIDLRNVHHVSVTEVPVANRYQPALTFWLADPNDARKELFGLRFANDSWSKTGIEHSPLARFVDMSPEGAHAHS